MFLRSTENNDTTTIEIQKYYVISRRLSEYLAVADYNANMTATTLGILKRLCDVLTRIKRGKYR